MAVQARHPSHAYAYAFFPYDLHAFRPMDDAAVPGPAFLDEHGWIAPASGLGGAAALGDFPRGEPACDYGFQPRKRPRVALAAAGCLDDRSAVLPVAAAAQELVPAVREGSGAASTSGRAAGADGVPQPQGLLARLWRHQDAEIDALVTLESERMRAALEEARRRHARALLAAAFRAASGRLRAAEGELGRALRRNAELEEEARQVAAECEAWMGVARSHEAVAAGLRATLHQLLHSPQAAASVGGCDGDAAEDAQSCCFEAPAADADVASKAAASSSCRACGGGDACVLLLPCRHLCLCPSCEAGVDACPVCAAAKNASLHVRLS
ncbi:unnamed protein product [Urochloa decumbens]|uniref:RING-type domain-containing protein n=1 Tax=Urochloa decumbens TaxID=240449 RepID=A0ABC9F1P1_9POAL